MKLKAAELCAGYGGLALAVEEVFGAETAWVSEFEAAPSKILAHRWPNTPNHGDMTKIDWASVEPVDIISGGTPCQDLSGAGRRKGMTEGTRSNLWVQMREAIAIIKPTYVVWENVKGAYSAEASSEMEQSEGRLGANGDPFLRALGRVLGDLSDLGFDAEWRGLRAADVGAPHGRFRVFVLATHPDRDGGERRGIDSLVASAPRTGEADRGERQRNGNATHYRGTLDPRINWGKHRPAVERWEAIMGRRAPAPTEPTGPEGRHRLSASFGEWMMGLPEGWLTDVPGVNRKEALKAAGNGVVPAHAIAALRDMLPASIELKVAA